MEFIDTDESMRNPFLKYENKDKMCEYPFTPDPAGYCWTYANYIDQTTGFEVLNCEGCECYGKAN
ncbi:hypothetical protein LCGC14_2010860 [marine sediment metagenome]|uniref:Uncharacterized protein n=1 Tax=marine sediment metagenome TaxID=412755 RepID=A0A0F9FMW9_9ZZZZ